MICYVVVFLLILVLYFLFIGYYDGTHFKYSKNNCIKNKIRLVKYKLLSNDLINKLENIINYYGDKLDPNINLSNAKGTKLDYIGVKKYIPELINFYLNEQLLSVVENILQKKIYFAPENDKYRLFVRLYSNENDFLNWHYDNNFTSHKRYTLVIPVLLDECNTSEFEVKNRCNFEIERFKIKLGTCLIYNGSNVYHRITKQTKNCKRLVIIIPLYEKYNMNIIGKIKKVIRDITHKIITI